MVRFNIVNSGIYYADFGDFTDSFNVISNKVNVPYERFRKEGKFVVKETPCHDGNIRAVTYATKKGLDYIRKILRKDGYYNAEVTA